jgi:microsomal dipeptidase-like Zn-dependent dipeptidase
MKFSVGKPVGGPVTYKSSDGADSEAVKAIFATGGVVQVFMTGDFVSVTKQPDVDWATLLPAVRAALEAEYGS